MSNEKPVALELAEFSTNWGNRMKTGPNGIDHTIAAELRRQHARIQELEAMLDAVCAGCVSAQRITQAEAIEELRADSEEEHDERLRFERAAHDAKAAIDAALAAITEAMPAGPLDFARDLAGHINLMACHGDSDYLKSKGQSIRHIDTRESRPRERKQEQ
jgi:hypothetical protein